MSEQKQTHLSIESPPPPREESEQKMVFCGTYYFHTYLEEDCFVKTLLTILLGVKEQPEQ